MAIYDHTLKFTDEAAAHKVLDALGFGGMQLSQDGKTSTPYWDQSKCIPNQAIITAEAVWNNSTFPPTLVSPEVTVPGFYITIALDHISDELKAITGNALRFVANRDVGGPGPQCIVYLAPDIEPAILTGSRVRTVFAGSGYVFGI